MLQSIRKELGGKISYDEIAKQADESDYDYYVDATDNRYFAPESMIGALKDGLKEQNAPEPKGNSDIFRSTL